MKTWFRSLKRGTQIALIVSLVVVTGALAWGIWTMAGHGTVSLAPGLVMTPLGNWTCPDYGPGTISCTGNGASVDATMLNVEDTSHFQIVRDFQNDSPGPVCITLNLPTIPHMLIVMDPYTSRLTPGASTNLSLDISFPGLVPSDVIAPFDFSYNAAACP